ncbi:e3 ubiquitin-protein ligase rififylin [Nephila pilipes]|uniref:E3 ubiquitin-protein ligase rififylin n=1 Tax=Nephila pilipes TaxID=299642 RepID=A0A8X6PG17_NEPPI|nr:e3 ubiquitin-protein ligase rififylin [Nephila pilipes]
MTQAIHLQDFLSGELDSLLIHCAWWFKMSCEGCSLRFTILKRKKKCEDCGFVFCSECTTSKGKLYQCYRCKVFTCVPLNGCDVANLKLRDLQWFLDTRGINVPSNDRREKPVLVDWVMNYSRQISAQQTLPPNYQPIYPSLHPEQRNVGGLFGTEAASTAMDENKSDPTALNFDNPNTEINRVAVKPPFFWRNKPKLWFLQLEAQFANSGISQDATKYNIVVAALDENVLDFVVDILSNPPENEKYNTLKKALLNRLTDTEESRLKKLLTDLELGDKRPSDLLHQMKSLAGNSISDEIIKSLWLQRLPQQTQAILTISNDTLDKIAEMADKIIAVYSSSEICQVTKVGSLPNSVSSFDRNKLDVLQADIAALTKKFDEFSRNTRSRSKSRGNDRRRRSRSNSARYEFCCCDIFYDSSTKKKRPYILESFRKIVFNSVHNLAHPGIKATIKLLKSKFVWPSINKDARTWTRSCLKCQKSKVTRHVQSPFQQYHNVSKRFTEINLDIIGPLPSSEGFRYCLTIIDRYSQWPEAIPLPDIRAETVADNLLKGWIARFGTPLVITTDQATQFEAQLFQELSQLIGFKRNRTASYHPQANGCIERWHRTLKASIMCHENESWTRSLPIILLGLRTTWRADFQSTPAELLYGENIRLPCDFFEDTKFQPQSEFVQKLKATMKQVKPIPFSYNCKQKPFVFKDLKNCSHVFVRTDIIRQSLQLPYHGPYQTNPPAEGVEDQNERMNSEVKENKPTINIGGNKHQIIDLDSVDSRNQIFSLSAMELKFLLTRNFISFRGCCEKSELQEKVCWLWDLKEAAKNKNVIPDENLCKICMEANIDSLFLDCGHMVTCHQCGKLLHDCPICRQIILRVVRAFKS